MSLFGSDALPPSLVFGAYIVYAQNAKYFHVRLNIKLKIP